MEPWHVPFRGQFHELTLTSTVLRGNPLGDPVERPIWVYVPPGYDSARRYSTIYLLQALTRQGDMWWNRSAFRPTIPEQIDALFSGSDAPACILVLVDAWTSLGGSQFLNSSGTGRYMDYLCDDVITFVDERFATLPQPGHRAVSGHSSGGYGAMVTAMLRPDVFGAFASHSGDALFEVCYEPDFRIAARALQSEYGGSWDAFWHDFRSRPAFTRSNDHVLLNVYCMATCYSADPDGRPLFPFDLVTGRLDDDIWARWLALDPVRLAPHHAEALAAMRGIYVDAGRHDEVFLDRGAIAFVRELDRLGVAYRFELFDAGHSSIEYRYPLAWRYLAGRIAP